jgi:hypothetical protein
VCQPNLTRDSGAKQLQKNCFFFVAVSISQNFSRASIIATHQHAEGRYMLNVTQYFTWCCQCTTGSERDIVKHPLFDAKHVVPVEVAAIVHAIDANTVTPLELSPSQTISKNFFRAAKMAKDKTIDWNSTLLSILGILAKHASSSQESERQRVV